MTGIDAYSTTPANNNSPPPNGWPEGMAPSGVNDSARKNMADLRTWYEIPQWINLGYTHVYASSTSFTIATTDYTAVYHVGRRIKAVGLSTGEIYGTIITTAYSSSTTVTISWDSGSLSNETLTISISALTKTNDAIPYLNKQAADVASAATIDLNAIRGELVDVTGTTAITTITLTQGHSRIIRFTGILTFTHGASLVLPTAANITTAAGDYAIVAGYASSVVRCVGYFRADGTNLTNPSAATNFAISGKLSITSAGTLTIATGAVTVTGSNHLLDGEGAAADTLDTVNGLVNGQVIVFQIVSAARPITFSLSGNMLTQSGESLVVNSRTTIVRGIYRSSDSKLIIEANPRLYQSTGQTISIAGGLTLAHGFGKAPDLIKTYLQCTSADHSYSVGDTLDVRSENSTASQDGTGFNLQFDTTNITIRFGNTGAGTIVLLDKTTGGATFIDNSKWQLYVRAFLFT